MSVFTHQRVASVSKSSFLLRRTVCFGRNLMARNRAVGDPNFPEGGLTITPSYAKFQVDKGNEWQKDKQEDIEEYGIAGRVWEAAYVLTRYLSCPISSYEFDPPCSFFQDDDDDDAKGLTVLELGAGVGVAGIHLALELIKARNLTGQASRPTTAASKDTIILTDLGKVLSLLNRNVKKAKLDEQLPATKTVDVQVRELAWGSNEHTLCIEKEFEPAHLTHILCSDLVYFPELLSPLLRSLIFLTRTQPHASQQTAEIVIGYKLRSYSKEEPFWKAFGVWFDFAPVLCKKEKEKEWRRLGSRAIDFGQCLPGQDEEEEASEDEMFVFIAHRKAVTLDCQAPVDDEHLLGGWLLRQNELQRGSGAETFELMLMNAIQG